MLENKITEEEKNLILNIWFFAGFCLMWLSLIFGIFNLHYWIISFVSGFILMFIGFKVGKYFE